MKNFIVCLLTLILLACEQNIDLKDLKESLQSEYQQRHSQVSALAEDEIEKMFAIEYKVFEIAEKNNVNILEDELNKFGKERWDCFFIDKNAESYRLFCRRKPKSYLRYAKDLMS